MGSLSIFFTVAFCIFEGYNVAAQCGRVEYLSQSAAGSLVQPISQFVVPAVIKPLIEPEKPAEPAKAIPDYSQFPCYPPMPYVIYKDDDDDDMRTLLYFLLFAMKNKGNSYVPQPIPYPYPVPMDLNGYSERFGYDRSYGNNANYMPYPLPSNCGYVDSNIPYENEITIVPTSIPGQPGREGEVTLLIRTEK